jgi:hypothetical protein
MEAGITRRVQQAGLPAPKVNRIVEWDGRRGILFDEFDEGDTLRRCVRRQPWRLPEAARLLAELQTAIHACSVPDVNTSGSPDEKPRNSNTEMLRLRNTLR